PAPPPRGPHPPRHTHRHRVAHRPPRRTGAHQPPDRGPALPVHQDRRDAPRSRLPQARHQRTRTAARRPPGRVEAPVHTVMSAGAKARGAIGGLDPLANVAVHRHLRNPRHRLSVTASPQARPGAMRTVAAVTLLVSRTRTTGGRPRERVPAMPRIRLAALI